MSNKSRRVVASLIEDEKCNILMGVRNDNGLWTTIGGHLENGEDPFVGMERELKEESNLEASKMNLVSAKWDKERNIIIYLFKIEISNMSELDISKDPDKEFKDMQFINPNEVVDKLHVPLERNIVLNYWMNS